MTDGTPPKGGDDPDAAAPGGEDAPATPAPGGEDASASTPTEDDAALDALRREVEETYDFDDFGPADMARMSAEEWDAAFDPDTWITGPELIDRVEAELQSRIATRDVFGVLKRVREAGEERLVVYSDEGYAVVRPTGQVSGRGTVLRDVEPTVALCAMDSYEVSEPPENWSLPDPDDVESGSGELGNWMMQLVAGTLLLGGVALIGAWLLLGVETLIAPFMGVLFVVAALFLLATVANARLSDRFRAAEYRDRLRALQAAEERPGAGPFEAEDGTDRDGER